MIRLEIPILFLEYYASGQAVRILKWGYSVAQSFSYETNWYEGTIAFTDDRSRVHVSFFIVYSVSSFTNGHYDSGVAINDGDHVVFEVNSSTEGFSESTDRNHGSPSTVDVWSSVATNDCVVNDHIGRTDGHSNDLISVDICCTNGISEGICIDCIAIVIFNCNNNIYCSFFVRIDSDCTILTINNIFCSFYFNICILVALISNIDISVIGSDISYSIAFFINNAISDSIYFISNTIFAIERKTCYNTFIYDSNRCISHQTINFTYCDQIYLITYSLFFICISHININGTCSTFCCLQNCRRCNPKAIIGTICDICLNTIFIYSINFISKACFGVSNFFISRFNGHLNNCVFVKFTYSEGGISISTSFLKSDTYSIFTRN